MNVSAVRTGIFREADELAAFVATHIPKLKNGTILAVTSKIVALAEGRTAEGGQKEKERLIKKEATWIQKVLPKWWLTVRDGIVIVNAGIDESNADNKMILLPRDSFQSAASLRAKLIAHYKIKQLGIVITDSRVEPLRAGVTGVALGYAGFKGVRDYRGMRDIFGKKMEVTRTNVADSLATAAALVMGEGSERQPLAVVEDAPVVWSERADKKELRINLKDDMYRNLFKKR